MVRILSSSAFICSKVHLFPILPCVFYLASRLSANSQALVCQIAAGPWQLGGIHWSVVPVAFQMHAVSLQPCLGRSQSPSHLRQQIILFILLCLCVERFTKLRNRGLSSESVPNQCTMQWINKWEANHLFTVWINLKSPGRFASRIRDTHWNQMGSLCRDCVASGIWRCKAPPGGLCLVADCRCDPNEGLRWFRCH